MIPRRRTLHIYLTTRFLNKRRTYSLVIAQEPTAAWADGYSHQQTSSRITLSCGPGNGMRHWIIFTEDLLKTSLEGRASYAQGKNGGIGSEITSGVNAGQNICPQLKISRTSWKEFCALDYNLHGTRDTLTASRFQNNDWNKRKGGSGGLCSMTVR